MDPLVSVVTITYNHENYIAKCIEGVLCQHVTFPMEFIIAEDCSTDRTFSICSEYAKRYPETIVLTHSAANMGALANERRAMSMARGKYIALCEGDDYWTDPGKLQKQVDFLERNSEYSVCFHDRLICRGELLEVDPSLSRYKVSDEDGFIISKDLFLKEWLTYPFSVVFRSSCLELSWYDHYKYFRDTHLFFLLLQKGLGYIFFFIGGVRVIHDDSMYYSMNKLESARVSCEVFKEIYDNNSDPSDNAKLKDSYLKSLHYYQELLISNKKRMRALSIAFKEFSMNASLKQLVKSIDKIVKVYSR